MLSKSQSNAEAWIFIATGINKFISHLQNNFICKKKKYLQNKFIVMILILINKDVFEPSYNDLKFRVQNCNYFCTNIIVTEAIVDMY